MLGRKKLGVKVCSCPRRDMLKEEEIEKKKVIGEKSYKRCATQVIDNEIPQKITKTVNNSDENTFYNIPIVCIFINLNIMMSLFIILFKS